MPPHDPANYRPISLLNTDIKSYAKQLAAQHMPHLIHPDLIGFIPHQASDDGIHWSHPLGWTLSNAFSADFSWLRKGISISRALARLGAPNIKLYYRAVLLNQTKWLWSPHPTTSWLQVESTALIQDHCLLLAARTSPNSLFSSYSQCYCCGLESHRAILLNDPYASYNLSSKDFYI